MQIENPNGAEIILHGGEIVKEDEHLNVMLVKHVTYRAIGS